MVQTDTLCPKCKTSCLEKVLGKEPTYICDNCSTSFDKDLNPAGGKVDI